MRRGMDSNVTRLDLLQASFYKALTSYLQHVGDWLARPGYSASVGANVTISQVTDDQVGAFRRQLPWTQVLRGSKSQLYTNYRKGKIKGIVMIKEQGKYFTIKMVYSKYKKVTILLLSEYLVFFLSFPGGYLEYIYWSSCPPVLTFSRRCHHLGLHWCNLTITTSH